tara:strand:- start:5073 stop:6224 length:1152 start_codon:yes stop_codon:yes gene_type:complete
MKINLAKNVIEETKDRIRFLFDEFEEVIVGFSGGKDSTCTLAVSLEVAREKGRLPLKVAFIDQEAEWQATIDYVKEIMYSKDIEPLWYQMPLLMTNSTSTEEAWLECWAEADKDKWVREKDPISIKENVYGQMRFKELFGDILKHDYPNKSACYIAGVRSEESPTRFVALTQGATYKHITYGRCYSTKRQHMVFYPLYDWSLSDVWKYIYDNKLSYCKIYDLFYQHGIPTQNMRVSNVHHETAIAHLYFLQEIEPKTWNKLTNRLQGINTAGQMNKASYEMPKELPYMFESWAEYRDYLIEHMLPEDSQKKFRKEIARLTKKYDNEGMKQIDVLHKVQVKSIIINDYEFTLLNNWEKNPAVHGWRQYQMGRFNPKQQTNKYIF